MGAGSFASSHARRLAFVEQCLAAPALPQAREISRPPRRYRFREDYSGVYRIDTYIAMGSLLGLRPRMRYSSAYTPPRAALAASLYDPRRLKKNYTELLTTLRAYNVTSLAVFKDDVHLKRFEARYAMAREARERR